MNEQEYTQFVAEQIHAVMYNLYCGLMINSKNCKLADVKRVAEEICMKALDSIHDHYADHVESLNRQVMDARGESEAI